MGPENGGPKKIKILKNAGTGNDGPNCRAGKCRTWRVI